MDKKLYEQNQSGGGIDIKDNTGLKLVLKFLRMCKRKNIVVNAEICEDIVLTTVSTLNPLYKYPIDTEKCLHVLYVLLSIDEESIKRFDESGGLYMLETHHHKLPVAKKIIDTFYNHTMFRVYIK